MTPRIGWTVLTVCVACSVEAVFAPSRGSNAAPAMCAVGLTVHAVWLDDEGGRVAVRYRRSADDGKTWGEAVFLTPEVWRRSGPPAIAGGREYVHVAWVETGQNPAGEVVYLRSRDGGRSWGAPRVLEREADGARWIAIARWSRSVYLSWTDRYGRLRFKRSEDEGETWFPAVVLGRRQRWESCPAAPQVYAAGRDLVFYWADVRQDVPGLRAWLGVVPVFTGNVTTVAAIDARTSADGGATWTTGGPLVKEPVDRGSTLHFRYPHLVAEGLRQAVVWAERTERVGGGRLRWLLSDNGGRTWMLEGTVEAGGTPRRPTAAMRAGQIHLVWSAVDTASATVRVARVGSEGEVASTAIAGTGPRTLDPVMCVSGDGTMHVLACEEQDALCRLRYFRSTDGVSWEEWHEPTEGR